MKVTNVGSVTATGPFSVYLYDSADASFDPLTTTDQPVNSVTHRASVRAGKSATFRVPFTAPAGMTPGSYKLYAGRRRDDRAGRLELGQQRRVGRDHGVSRRGRARRADGAPGGQPGAFSRPPAASKERCRNNFPGSSSAACGFADRVRRFADGARTGPPDLRSRKRQDGSREVILAAFLRWGVRVGRQRS